MKKKYHFVIYLIFFIMAVAHISLFVSGITLSDEINKYDNMTKNFKQENIDLETKLYSVESLAYAASEAAKLDYTKKTSPLYLESLGIAMKK